MALISRIQRVLKQELRFVSSAFFSTEQTRQHDLEQRRTEIMAKGLPKRKPIPGVRQIVLVASGKGGVGKSTTAVNLAVGIKMEDPTKGVGLLDADVFGPTVPLMMNLSDTPVLNDQNLMEPLENYGVKCMSMGFLIGQGSPLVWRGLMVMQALNKLLWQVAWGDIDYLIVDTPPGTGDTHLTLAQSIPIAGAVLVTTPQHAAVEVTKRGAAMLDKLNVPIIGIVDNMTSVKCPNCHSDVELFGDASQAFAQSAGMDVIARMPLEREISSTSDMGVPIVVARPESFASDQYRSLAKAVMMYCDNKDMKLSYL